MNEDRIKIAKACGYHRRRVDHGEGFKPYDAWFKDGLGHHFEHDAHLPDYLNDLNAMHDAEVCLIDQGHGESYQKHLQSIAGGYLSYHLASASQRAKAFILSLENVKK